MYPKRSLILLWILSSFIVNTSFAEVIDWRNYNNFDPIEQIWYFHSSTLIWDSCWWGYYDARFAFNWWLSWKKEFSDFFSNISWLGCKEVSLWILNNLPQRVEQRLYWKESVTVYSPPLELSDSSWTEIDIQNINKTSPWDFFLIPSKKLRENVNKSLSLNWVDESEVLFKLQWDIFKWKKVKITWKFYKIKGKYTITWFEDVKKEVDFDLNVIIVDNIDLNIKTKDKIIKEQVALYKWKIDLLFSKITDYNAFNQKIELFLKVFSQKRYVSNPIIVELTSYIKQIQLERQMDNQDLDIEKLFSSDSANSQ